MAGEVEALQAAFGADFSALISGVQQAVSIQKELQTQVQGLGTSLDAMAAKSGEAGEKLANDMGKAGEGVKGLRRAIREVEEALKGVAEFSIESAKAFNPEGARSYEDAIARMKDAVGEAASHLGDVLMPAIEEVTNVITGAVDKFNELDDGTKETIVTVIAIAGALVGLVVVFGQVMETVELLSAGLSALGVTSLASLGPILLVIGAVGAAIALLIVAVDEIKKHMEATGETVGGVWTTIKNGATQAVDWIVQAFTTGFNKLGEVMMAPIVATLQGIAFLQDQASKLGIGEGGGDTRNLAEAFAQGGSHLGDDLVNGAKVAGEVMVAGVKGAGELLVSGAHKVKEDFNDLTGGGFGALAEAGASHQMGMPHEATIYKQPEVVAQKERAEQARTEEEIFKLRLQHTQQIAEIEREAGKKAAQETLEKLKDGASTAFETLKQSLGTSNQAAATQQWQAANDALSSQLEANDQAAKSAEDAAKAQYDGAVARAQLDQDTAINVSDIQKSSALEAAKQSSEAAQKAGADYKKAHEEAGAADLANEKQREDMAKQARELAHAQHQMQQQAALGVATSLAGSGAGGLIGAAVGGATGTNDIGKLTGGGPQGAIAAVADQLLQQSQSFQSAIKVLNQLVQMLSNAVGSEVAVLIPLIQTITNALEPVMLALGNVLGHLGASFAGLAQVVVLLEPILTSLANLVDDLAPVVQLVYTIFMMQVMPPFVILGAALQLLAPAIQTLANGVQIVVNAITSAWNAMVEGVAKLLAGVAKTLSDAGLGFLAGPVSALSAEFQGMTVSTANFSAALTQSAQVVLTAFQQMASSAYTSSANQYSSAVQAQQANQETINAAKAMLQNPNATSAQQAMAEKVLAQAQQQSPVVNAQLAAAVAQQQAAYAQLQAAQLQERGSSMELSQIQADAAGANGANDAAIAKEILAEYDALIAEGKTQAQALQGAIEMVSQSTATNAAYTAAVAQNTSATNLNTQAMLALTNGPQGFAAQAEVYSALQSTLSQTTSSITQLNGQVQQVSGQQRGGLGSMQQATGTTLFGTNYQSVVSTTGAETTGPVSSSIVQMSQAAGDAKKGLDGLTWTLTQSGQQAHSADDAAASAVTDLAKASSAAAAAINAMTSGAKAATSYTWTGSGSGPQNTGTRSFGSLTDTAATTTSAGISVEGDLNINWTGSGSHTKSSVDGVIKEVRRRAYVKGRSRTSITTPGKYRTDR